MTVREPERYVISGVDGDGNAVPVCARVTCADDRGDFSSVLLVRSVHGYVRNQREEGYVVTVEWLYEVPTDLMGLWAAMIIEQGGYGHVDLH
jgi:hypothetical protein